MQGKDAARSMPRGTSDGEAEIGRGLLTAACSRAVGRHELLPEVPKLRRVHHHELDLPTGRRTR
jgi:hypothetical protein